MAYELKPYQEAAVYDEADGLLANTLRFLKSSKHKRLFVLKSIMGSGKTIIASECIQAILNSDDSARIGKEICIIWLSKGNAGLHMQSSEKLQKAIDDKDIHIYGIRDSIDFNADRFYDKDVYVINWEKINNMKDGELVNNLFVESEMKNLRSAKRNSPDVEFIFIIDEFHMNYGTESYKKIVDFFDPHVIIGMSATPSDEQMALADAKYSIPVADVIAEGMVKKGICFNTASDYTDDEISAYDTIDEFFLRLALRQRDILEKKYRAVGSDVVPLLLIQFNDDKTNEDIIRIKDVLDKEYDNNRGDVYAIWISETDNKKDKLRSPDHIIQGLDNNTVRILLFKQAVATGWDCPRAHVLLRYRRVATRKDANEVSSFDVQTLGRIFRMPEPNKFSGKQYKHYDDEDLNYGYVFVPNNSYVLEKEFKRAFGDDAEMFEKGVVTVDYSDKNEPEEIESQTTLSFPEENPKEYIPEEAETITESAPNISAKGSVSANKPHTTDNISTNETQNATQEQTTSGLSNPAHHTVPQKTESQKYAEEFGPTILNAEKVLSVVQVVAEDKKPNDDEIKKKIKDILKSICVQRDIRESDSYTGQITFYGKTMEINDALFETNGTVKLEESGTSFSVSDTPAVLADKADKLLRELIDRKQYSKAVKNYLKKQIKIFFRKKIAGSETVDDKTSAETSKLILLNEKIIKQIIDDTDRAIKELSKYTFKRTQFSFPTSFRTPPSATPSSKGLMHFPLANTASGPERIFEEILDEQNNNVLLWYKNADHGMNAFCVPYSMKHQIRSRSIDIQAPTYPDFIVIFKDSSIGIYEIKDYDKKDDKDTEKALAISETINALINEGYPAKGGLIYINQHTKTIHAIEKHPEL